MADDRLADAFRALRDEVDGQSDQADAGLRRVLAGSRSRMRKRTIVTRVGFSFAALFVASSVWATADQGWETTWTQLVGFFSSAPSVGAAPPPVPAHAIAPNEQSDTSASPLEPSAPDTHAPSADLSDGVPPAPEPARTSVDTKEPTVAPALPEAERRTPRVSKGIDGSPRVANNSAESRSMSAATSAKDDFAEEKALFERAHRIHNNQAAPVEAIAAWDAYLQAHPNGRFVPEARYARAVALARAGHIAQARAALHPFATAPAGSYRQQDAQRLIDALQSAVNE